MLLFCCLQIYFYFYFIYFISFALKNKKKKTPTHTCICKQNIRAGTPPTSSPGRFSLPAPKAREKRPGDEVGTPQQLKPITADPTPLLSRPSFSRGRKLISPLLFQVPLPSPNYSSLINYRLY